MLWIFLTMAAGFGLELFLCLRLSSAIRKLIPVFVDLALMLVLAVVFSDGSLTGTFAGYSAETLLWAMFVWGALVLLAMLVAWPVSWAVEHVRDKRLMEE